MAVIHDSYCAFWGLGACNCPAAPANRATPPSPATPPAAAPAADVMGDSIYGIAAATPPAAAPAAQDAELLMELSAHGELADHPLSRQAYARIAALNEQVAALTRENSQWQTWGIAEIAIRNPSVMEYMRHWEGRAESAEARCAAMERAIVAAAKAMDDECLCYASYGEQPPQHLLDAADAARAALDAKGGK